MLAKIAHAFAVAEKGLGSFVPFLTPIICNADTSNSVQYIGGLPQVGPAAAGLHELSFASCDCPEIVAVRIRLLAPLETPTYYVAVGRRCNDALPDGSGSFSLVDRLNEIGLSGK